MTEKKRATTSKRRDRACAALIRAVDTQKSLLPRKNAGTRKKKRPLATLPRMDTTVLPIHAGAFFMNAKESCMPAKSFGKHVSNVRMDTANGTQTRKNVRMLAKDFRMDAKEGRMDRKDGRKVTKDCRMHTREFSMHARKLCVLAKSPGKHANFFRMHGKSPMQDADVLLQDGSAAPMLAESRFMHTFFPRNMHQEISKDSFFVGKRHPPSILHALSEFVSKQRAFLHDPARTVDNEDAVRGAEMPRREAATADIQKLSMRSFYEPPVSQDETPQEEISTLPTLFASGSKQPPRSASVTTGC